MTGRGEPVFSARPADLTLTRALRGRMTFEEWETLPLADEETGGCPNCPGKHYGATGIYETFPAAYSCHGTDCWDEPVYPCRTLFRGRPGVHYDAEWYAVASVGAFIRRAANSHAQPGDD